MRSLPMRRPAPGFNNAPSGSPNRWMASYMDVVTVLLILFIALSAQALQHPAKKPDPPPPPQRIVVVQPPAPAPPEPKSKLLTVQTHLAQLGLDSQLEPRGLVISLPQAILFAPGQDQISKDALPTVGRIAEVLRDIPNRASLIGHADAMPIHNGRFHSNWELSAARSLRILEVLTKEYGLPESRLSIASYGAFSPQATNDTAGGRASNRRVEIVILDDDGSEP